MMAAAHVVVFSELSPRSKVQYTRFLLGHDVKFAKRASDGNYVASIRLHGASGPALPRDGGSAAGPNREESGAEPEDGDGGEAAELVSRESDRRLTGIPPELHQYINLISLIGRRGAAQTGARVFVKETRLVRLMNEIYDARHEDVSSSDSYSSTASNDRDGSLAASRNAAASNAFSRFIKHYLTNRFGLKKLVEQEAWELVDGLHSLQHRIDVELFASFLQGKYSESTLLFTLFARAAIQRVMTASAYRPTLSKSTPNERKTRKSASTSAATIPVWLSKSQVETLAQTIFGSRTEDAFLEFMHAMKAFVLSQPSGRSASRLVEANELLFIAAETYEKTSSLDKFTSSAAFDDTSTNLNLCEADDDDNDDDGDGCMKEEDEPVASPVHQLSRQGVAPASRASSVLQQGITKAGGREEKKSSKCSAVSSPAPANANANVNASASESDVQKRLGSLLERMKKRQQQPDE